jgi:hypothetical protein
MSGSFQRHDPGMVKNSRTIRCFALALIGFASIGRAAPASAALVISGARTAHVTCQNGTCTASAVNAVLNVGALQRMLNKGNVVVSAYATPDIDLAFTLTWARPTTLTLAAPLSVKIDAPVTVAGHGGLAIISSTGPIGGLSFGPQGSVWFWDVNSSLRINNVGYTLVDSIATLAGAIAKNPSGYFALSRSYDAGWDGTYASAPIGVFSGTVEGLGNTIYDFILVAGTDNVAPALFAEVDGALRDLRLTNASVIVNASDGGAALLASRNRGTIAGSYVSGTLTLTTTAQNNLWTGGVTGENEGQILNSSSSVAISADNALGSEIGGLVGANDGIVRNSWAIGTLNVSGEGCEVRLGGLIGQNNAGALVQRSWSRVHMIDSTGWAGGLVGDNQGFIQSSHAEGELKISQPGIALAFGGLVGIQDSSAGRIDDSFAAGSVYGGMQIGGLVGDCEAGEITRSFASAAVRPQAQAVGGLVGISACAISDVYSTGPVFAKTGGAGGLIGIAAAEGSIARAYAAGAVGASKGAVGGFVCTDETSDGISDAYWDSTTTGAQTASCNGTEPRVKPLTTSQLQSGLPAGFDPTIWIEKASVNGGLPYLIANPPPQ